MPRFTGPNHHRPNRDGMGWQRHESKKVEFGRSHHSNEKKDKNGDNYYGVGEDNTTAMSIYEFEENDQDFQFCNVNHKTPKTTNLGSIIKNPYELKEPQQQQQHGYKKRNVSTIKTVHSKRHTEKKVENKNERGNHPNSNDKKSPTPQQKQQLGLLEIPPQAIAFDTRVLQTFESESAGSLFLEYGTNFLRLCDKRGLSPNIVCSTYMEGSNHSDGSKEINYTTEGDILTKIHSKNCNDIETMNYNVSLASISISNNSVHGPPQKLLASESWKIFGDLGMF